MADIDRQTYAYDCLREASKCYDEMAPATKREHPELAVQLAIGHFLKLLTDATVRFDGSGNVIRQNQPST